MYVQAPKSLNLTNAIEEPHKSPSHISGLPHFLVTFSGYCCRGVVDLTRSRQGSTSMVFDQLPVGLGLLSAVGGVACSNPEGDLLCALHLCGGPVDLAVGGLRPGMYGNIEDCYCLR